MKYRVPMGFLALIDELILVEWLNENVGYDFWKSVGHMNKTFLFQDEQDAALFALKWIK